MSPEVVVVNDDMLVRELLDLALPGYGFGVRLAADGTEAAELYQRHGGDGDLPHVVVSVRATPGSGASPP
jgi:CheY-like chemotaxis protein